MDSVEKQNVGETGRTSVFQRASSWDIEKLSRRDRNKDALSSVDTQTYDSSTADEEIKASHGIDIQSAHYQLIELETENFRLQRLVAELLIKNQELRDLNCGGAA
ncbi:MAG: hypothetical protein WA708_02040 [Acidobacteriaceae bacterium]